MRVKKYKELVKLKGLIRERKETYVSLAESIGLSSASIFSNKINGFSVFTLAEVLILVKELKIDSEKIYEYFF